MTGPATGAQSDVYLGFSVAVDGGLTAVGAPRDDTGGTNSGVVKVFDTATGALLHLIPNPSPNGGDFFGISVAISGTRLLVGASEDDTGATDTGRAYVFDLGGSTPTLPVATLDNPAPAAGDQFGRSVSISGLMVVVGAYQDDAAGNNAGSAYVYDLADGSPTIPVATLNSPSPAASDFFGWSVSVSGTRLVVGAFLNDTGATDAGRAYVFDLASGTPTVPVLTLNHPSMEAGDQFGYSVAISGNRVVVGARNDDTGTGTAHVFNLDSGSPAVPEATFINPSPATLMSFGYSVAISGNRVVAAAPYDETSGAESGIACVYDLAGQTPTVPSVIFNPPSLSSGNWFGRCVAISGTIAVVGSPNEDIRAADSGCAYVYDLTSSTPTEPVANLNSSGPAASNLFGYSVSISGTLMVVGTPSDDTVAINAGRTYVYDLAGTTPASPIATLNNPESSANDYFGWSVSISGRKLVIGAPYQDTGANDAGRAYVYDMDSQTPNEPVLVINNPDPQSSDHFGSSTAISGTRIIIGAHGDDTGASDAGSAYVYDLASATPTAPAHEIHNPHPAAQDHFGFSLGISNTRAVIGAYRDDTAAEDSGSAYVYDLASATPTEPAIILNNPAAASFDWFGYAVGIAGNQVVIGSPLDDTGAANAGRAYAYDLAGETPAVPVATFSNPSPAASDSFGWTAAISSSRVLIGTPGRDSDANNSGNAYVYDLNGSTPTEPSATLNNPNPATNDQFGASLAIYGKTCVIGVPYDDSLLPDSGAAFVYGPAAQIIVEQPTGTSLAESNSSIDYGSVFTNGNGETLAFTIRNNGTADLNDIALSPSGTHAGDFILNTADTASSLPPGTSTIFSVRFQPAATGLRAATLSITSGNGDVNPFMISLSGTGTLPAISLTVTPSTVSEDGASNLLYTFTRNGPTDDPLTVSFDVSGTALFGSDYSQSGADAFSASSGTISFAATSATTTLALDPEADTTFEADESATLTMAAGSGYAIGSPDSATGMIGNDDSPDQLVVEQPEGNALTSGSSTINHGTVLIGAPNIRTFEIRNTGTLPISSLSVTILGSNSSDFIASSPPSSLNAGNSTSFTVTFTPAAAGGRSATLRITSNNIGETPFEISLTGTGSTPRDLFDAYVSLAGLSGANAQPNTAPFSDGTTNLLKYALNMDAAGPDNRTLVPGTGTAGLPVLLYLNSPAPTLHFEFLRRKNSGLTYTPLQSATMHSGWEPMTGTITVSEINAAWERVIIEQAVTSMKRFFRMQVVMD